MKDLTALNSCLATCGKPLEYQSEYAMNAYAQENARLQQEMQGCIGKKDEEACLEKAVGEGAKGRIQDFKRQYQEYLDDLVKRKVE